MICAGTYKVSTLLHINHYTTTASHLRFAYFRYEKKKPHFTANLLEMFASEPRLCKARAFNEVSRILYFSQIPY